MITMELEKKFEELNQLTALLQKHNERPLDEETAKNYIDALQEE